MSDIDILGLGCLAWDKLLFIDGGRQTDGKISLVRHCEQVGGNAGNALRAAARYGAKAAWAGVVGTDAASNSVLAGLAADGVDVSLAKKDAAAGVIQCWVVVDSRRQSRVVYYDLGRAYPCSETYPPEEIIAGAKALLVDTFGLDGMLRAIDIARRNNVPVVADCEVAEAEGLGNFLGNFLDAADHLILPHAIAAELTGTADPAAAVSRLWNDTRQAVVVTCGEGGSWYRGREMPAFLSHHCPAFSIDAVDTTGCGDIFHGIYAAALAGGLSLEDRLLHATAAAAIKATRYPGEAPLPNRREVEEFLCTRS